MNAKINPKTQYSASGEVATEKAEKSPEEVQKERLKKISKDVMRAKELLVKLASYSGARYKLTEEQVKKLRDEVDAAYSRFNASIVVSGEKSSIFD